MRGCSRHRYFLMENEWCRHLMLYLASFIILVYNFFSGRVLSGLANLMNFISLSDQLRTVSMNSLVSDQSESSVIRHA